MWWTAWKSKARFRPRAPRNSSMRSSKPTLSATPSCSRMRVSSRNKNTWRVAMIKLSVLCVGVAALLAASSAVSAQSPDAGQYPNQRVTIVVPFSAGSNTDGQARIIADKLSEMWKQQVIVENRHGLPGTASVAKATPDGYTLMLTSSGHTVIDVPNKSLTFEPVTDFPGGPPRRLGLSAAAALVKLRAKTLWGRVAVRNRSPTRSVRT